MYEKIWSGDWHARILERVRKLGFKTVTAYAADRIGISLVNLAEELGNHDVAGVQVMRMLIEEAVHSHTVPCALRDLVVRWLREVLPHGWRHPLDEDARVRVAGALSRWATELQPHLDRTLTIKASKELLDTELPMGWLPEGPDDPVIVAFVERCLGHVPLYY
jgi:hypothetical protein